MAARGREGRRGGAVVAKRCETNVMRGGQHVAAWARAIGLSRAMAARDAGWHGGEKQGMVLTGRIGARKHDIMCIP